MDKKENEIDIDERDVIPMVCIRSIHCAQGFT